jgi:hypothetical protein
MDWNDWRARYDDMSWQDQVDFYERVGQAHPKQQHFTAIEVLRFARELPPAAQVLEIGGWRGEMAEFVLASCPDLARWLNIEVLADALNHHVLDKRYDVMIPNDFIWRVGLPQGYDALIMSHTIEHMRAVELELIIAQFDGAALYLEAPLDDPSQPFGWHDYPGSHILELNWDGVDRLIAAAGFEAMTDEEGWSPDTRVRTYQR